MTPTDRPKQSLQASRVLVVEARDQVAAPLCAALESAGFEVERTHKSLVALRRLGERAADAVLLGRDAEGLDPDQLAARLAPACSDPGIALVLLVEGDDPDLVRAGFEAGARDFLVLPAELNLAGERTLFALRAAGERADLDGVRRQVDLVQSAGQLGLWHWDAGQRSVSASPLACELLGFERGRGTFTLDELLASSSPESRAPLVDWLRQADDSGEVSCLNLSLDALSSVPRKLGLEAMGGARADGTPLFGIVRDLSERRGARVFLSDDTDTLTGLSTRTRFVEELGRAIAACGQSGSHLAVLCLDLNHFKSISDAFSPGAGEELLVQIAARLRDG
ncbi:MAG TPA: diguanylate cyclase, partial [Planctomycetota bacterium]|nr:diguanylate cyclase [Planctomycetota bacterium]